MFVSGHFVSVASCTGHALSCAVGQLYQQFSAVDAQLNTMINMIQLQKLPIRQWGTVFRELHLTSTIAYDKG